MINPKDSSLAFIALLMLIGSVPVVSGSHEGHAESASPIVLSPHILDSPLRVQFRSKYVTESANWGQLQVNEADLTTNDSAPDADVKAIKALIQTYHRRWLDGDEEMMASLLDQDVIRIRGGTPTFGIDSSLERIRNESRGERPGGFKNSLQYTIKNLDLYIESDFATASYEIDIRGGARWEFADLGTVFQAFQRNEADWKIIGHVESFELEGSSGSAVPDNVPNRVTPMHFDFVYPAENLSRAFEFYTPILGKPTILTETRASFRLNDMFFELETVPIEPRASLRKGQANGYAIINVDSLDTTQQRLENAGDLPVDIRPCVGGTCLLTEDSAANLIVFRERKTSRIAGDVNPKLNASGFPAKNIILQASVLSVMKSWLTMNLEEILGLMASDSTWVDDFYGSAAGQAAISEGLEGLWATIDQGMDGLDADLTVSNLQVRSFGQWHLASFSAGLKTRKAPMQDREFVAYQVWRQTNGSFELKHNIFRRQWSGGQGIPTDSLDYSGYPVSELGVAGGFYKFILDSEPYRDENWFGFWSNTSVFGLVGLVDGPAAYKPTPHRSNGYADFSINSAESIYEYLQSQGSTFPQLDGINGVAGIDEQPGYLQILATDSEGNIVNFSEYLEY